MPSKTTLLRRKQREERERRDDKKQGLRQQILHMPLQKTFAQDEGVWEVIDLTKD